MIALRVDNVSKSFRIAHQLQGAGRRYRTLREDLADIPKRLRARWRSGRGAASSGGRSEEFHALRDINFEVQQGEVLGIIGRNGAGKSTLLKILSRITEPSSGEVQLFGRVASLLEVGTGFHPELTGRENIFLNGAILGMRRGEISRKFDEIVDFAEVERFLDTPVKRYSSGMYTRLAFAVAAHLDPEILVVDEVLAVGDAEFQKKCFGKIEGLSKESGKTVLLVSHNMASVQALCHRCLLLQSGSLIEDTSNVMEAIERYHAQTRSSSARIDDIALENKLVKSLAIRTFEAATGRPQDVFASAEPIGFGVDFTVQEDFSYLSVGYALYECDSNTCLFWSFHVDAADAPRITAGPNHFASQIPAGWLNQGTYEIEVLIALHNQGWILGPGNGHRIRLEIIAGDYGSYLFATTSRPGLLKPVLPWKSNTP